MNGARTCGWSPTFKSVPRPALSNTRALCLAEVRSPTRGLSSSHMVFCLGARSCPKAWCKSVSPEGADVHGHSALNCKQPSRRSIAEALFRLGCWPLFVDSITIRHSLPCSSRPSGGSADGIDPRKTPAVSSSATTSLLCTWRGIATARQRLFHYVFDLWAPPMAAARSHRQCGRRALRRRHRCRLRA